MLGEGLENSSALPTELTKQIYFGLAFCCCQIGARFLVVRTIQSRAATGRSTQAAAGSGDEPFSWTELPSSERTVSVEPFLRLRAAGKCSTQLLELGDRREGQPARQGTTGSMVRARPPYSLRYHPPSQ